MDLIDFAEVESEEVYTINKEDYYGDIESKPEIEQILFRLQDRFYDPSEDKYVVWNEMYTWVHRYAHSLVKQRLKHKKFLPEEEIDDKASQATLAFMSQYIYKKGFILGGSFAGMIQPKVMEAMYSPCKEDRHASLNAAIEDSGTAFESFQKKVGMQNFMSQDINGEATAETELFKESLKTLIQDLFEEFDAEIKSPVIRLKMRMYMEIVLRKPRNKHAKEMFFKYNCNKEEYDLLNLIELEFHERLWHRCTSKDMPVDKPKTKKKLDVDLVEC